MNQETKDGIMLILDAAQELERSYFHISVEILSNKLTVDFLADADSSAPKNCGFKTIDLATATYADFEDLYMWLVLIIQNYDNNTTGD